MTVTPAFNGHFLRRVVGGKLCRNFGVCGDSAFGLFQFKFHPFHNTKFSEVPTPKYTKVADGLVIKKVTKSDSGEYTCKAYQVSTTISNTKEQTIRLNIQRKYICACINCATVS